MRTEIGLAHEVAQGRGAPETARSMNQFPHRPRLRLARGSKLLGSEHVDALSMRAPRRTLRGRTPAAGREEPLYFRGRRSCAPRDDKRALAQRLCASGPVFVALVMPRPAPNKKSDYLLIDISNSFTKLAFASKDKLGATERIETARLSEAAITKLHSAPGRGQIVVCSVVPKKDALIRRAAGKIRVLFVSAKCRARGGR